MIEEQPAPAAGGEGNQRSPRRGDLSAQGVGSPSLTRDASRQGAAGSNPVEEGSIPSALVESLGISE